MPSPGEEKAWDILRTAAPSEICRNASAAFDEEAGAYVLRSFCMDFLITPREKTIECDAPSGQFILKRFGYFFNHACLWYLIHARDIPPAGKLVRPVNIKGGEMFFRGSHVIPLDALAQKYGADREAFTEKGRGFCGEALNFGDASLRLLPMPRVPVTLILWLGDEEFPPRTDLLMDSSCEILLPIDIVWSVAMISVLVML